MREQARPAIPRKAPLRPGLPATRGEEKSRRNWDWLSGRNDGPASSRSPLASRQSPRRQALFTHYLGTLLAPSALFFVTLAVFEPGSKFGFSFISHCKIEPCSTFLLVQKKLSKKGPAPILASGTQFHFLRHYEYLCGTAVGRMQCSPAFEIECRNVEPEGRDRKLSVPRSGKRGRTVKW
jgi:hypothetical protein